MNRLLVCCLVVAHFFCADTSLLIATNNASAATIFESGTLGPTGVPFAELGGTVPGTNVNSGVFTGVRFQLTQPVVTQQVGGHFVERFSGTFFGAIVKLDDENDFPNSSNLSTPDVIGAANLTFPNPSAEVFGNLNVSLDPGWYALVFGSGLFGTLGTGGAVRNGVDIGDPSYISWQPNAWFNLDTLPLPFDNHRFVVKGTVIPEPSTFVAMLAILAFLSSFRLKSVPI